MMHSELEYFDNACEMHVFPHPKAPGIQQVPPKTEGNNASKTRYPVRSGTFPYNFSV
jgi:hypothetical protein